MASSPAAVSEQRRRSSVAAGDFDFTTPTSPAARRRSSVAPASSPGPVTLTEAGAATTPSRRRSSVAPTGIEEAASTTSPARRRSSVAPGASDLPGDQKQHQPQAVLSSTSGPEGSRRKSYVGEKLNRTNPFDTDPRRLSVTSPLPVTNTPAERRSSSSSPSRASIGDVQVGEGSV